MRRLIIIFLVGQLLLVSYIFNKSFYDSYETRNIGDRSLAAYQIEEPSGDTLNQVYSKFYEKYLANKQAKLQVIKMPVAEDKLIYEVYHSAIETIAKTKVISNNKEITYFNLEKEDFVDSFGVFYTDLHYSEVESLANDLNLSIIKYEENKISYSEIIKFNVLNFTLLVLLTTLVLFIYTFTQFKVNGIKKLLGYSNYKMLFSLIKQFIFIEGVAIVTVVLGHLIFYFIIQRLILNYFLLLILFLSCAVFANLLILLMLQVSTKLIDISAMIKNKIYSSTLNLILYVVKIVLIFSITISVSFFINSYDDYKKKTRGY